MRVVIFICLLTIIPAATDARPPLAELFDSTALYRRIAQGEALRNRMPFALVDAVMRVESGYDPLARGTVGEVGLMQLLPSTAILMGFAGPLDDLAEPHTNIAYGARYLADAWRLARGDICTTVMKYRAGHGETRFSVRSIEYCVRVRKHLQDAGFPVTGVVPRPTIGFGKPTGMVVTGRVRVRFGSSKCFARVIQPGRRFGTCILRSVLRKKGLLR